MVAALLEELARRVDAVAEGIEPKCEEDTGVNGGTTWMVFASQNGSQERLK
jgi:hypothetical protein